MNTTQGPSSNGETESSKRPSSTTRSMTAVESHVMTGVIASFILLFACVVGVCAFKKKKSEKRHAENRLRGDEDEKSVSVTSDIPEAYTSYPVIKELTDKQIMRPVDSQMILPSCPRAALSPPSENISHLSNFVGLSKLSIRENTTSSEYIVPGDSGNKTVKGPDTSTAI